MQSGGVVYVGSVSSAMQNYGTLTSTGLIKANGGLTTASTLTSNFTKEESGTTTTLSLVTAGRLRTILVSSSSTSYTIPTTINMEVYIIIQNGASGSILLPTAVTVGQKITFRSLSTNTITINSQSNNIVAPGTNSAVTTISLGAIATVTYYVYSVSPNYWISV